MKLTPRQQAYYRKKTKHDEPDPSEVASELNIVPFLDIVTNLILFLLMTSAQVLLVAELDAQLPTLARGRPSRDAAEESSTLNLNVTIADDGVIVAAQGGKLAPGCQSRQTGRVITIPRSGNREIPWQQLTQCAERVHTEYPDETKVILTADPTIEYQEIISAMDALRTNGTDNLFPDVMLSAGVR